MRRESSCDFLWAHPALSLRMLWESASARMYAATSRFLAPPTDPRRDYHLSSSSRSSFSFLCSSALSSIISPSYIPLAIPFNRTKLNPFTLHIHMAKRLATYPEKETPDSEIFWNQRHSLPIQVGKPRPSDSASPRPWTIIYSIQFNTSLPPSSHKPSLQNYACTHTITWMSLYCRYIPLIYTNMCY